MTLASSFVAANPLAALQKVVPIWTGIAPGSENWTQKEETTTLAQVAGGGPLVRNVTRPTLTGFLPDVSIATGTAIIVCPGGGFQFLPWEHEGTEIAKWLSARGIAAFVLKYRLLDTGPLQEDFQRSVAAFLALIERLATAPAEMRGGLPEAMQRIARLAIADGIEALKVVRQHASDWSIAPERVGMMGFSAGAIVTMGVLTQDTGTLPNFAGAIYGAGMERFTAPREAIPLFILCANNDPVSASGSAAAYSKWKVAGYPAELHIFAQGGHGFGMNKQGLPTDHWSERFEDWLQEQDLLQPKR
jgi:acetyl esterase/lipase